MNFLRAMTHLSFLIENTDSEIYYRWTVKLRQTNPSSEPREFKERCEVLLQATGILNKFKWPEIEGLEKFNGKVVQKLENIHGKHVHSLTRITDTAHWPKRLPRGLVEERVCGYHWLQRLFKSNFADNATPRQAYRCLRTNSSVVHFYCWE